VGLHYPYSTYRKGFERVKANLIVWLLKIAGAICCHLQEDDVKKSKVDLGEMLHLAVSSSCPE
jgi:hypothetical protein